MSTPKEKTAIPVESKGVKKSHNQKTPYNKLNKRSLNALINGFQARGTIMPVAPTIRACDLKNNNYVKAYELFHPRNPVDKSPESLAKAAEEAAKKRKMIMESGKKAFIFIIERELIKDVIIPASIICEAMGQTSVNYAHIKAAIEIYNSSHDFKLKT